MELQNPSPKPHVAMLPSPGMGHLIPLLEFAKRLVLLHGFSVTFITIKWGASSRQTAYTKRLASLGLNIRVVEIPEVDSEEHKDMKIEILLSKFVQKYKGPVEDLLRSLLNSPSPICAFITDLLCTGLLDVGASLRVPSYIFYTASASLLAFMLHLPKLALEIQISFKDMDSAVDVPGLLPIPARDLPSGLQDRNNDAFEWLVGHSSRLRKAKGILINTFHDLESQAIRALAERKIVSTDEFPAIYTVGPVISLPLIGDSEEVSVEDKAGCLEWLDRQPASSVLFVSFGSQGALSAVQIEELALGLEASRQRFLWVVRPPPPPASPPGRVSEMGDSSISEVLPRGFESRTKDRGLVVASWAPQIPVLSHPSTGGFLSHCGWNSTLESISFGVPIIAWPLFAEQRLNGFFLVNEIKTAIEAKAGADGIVRKEEVERVARELMEGEEGIQVRSRAKELKESAKRALAEGGSSYGSLAAVATVWKNISSEATRPHSGQSSMTLQSMD